MSEAIHRTVCDSISVAAGDSVQAPTFALRAAARKSPRMPIGAGGAVTYPKKRGWALNSECSKSRRAVRSSSGPASAPDSGSGPDRSSAWRTADGDSSRVTGPRGSASSDSAS